MFRNPMRAVCAATTALTLAFVASGATTLAASTTDDTTADTTASTDTVESTGPVFDQALHDALPADIRDAGFMTLATDPTDPPLEFYNEDNDIVGTEVDLAAALGVVLGIEIRLVPAGFDAIIPGVQAGRYDGSVSGFADRPARQEVVDFVDYFTTSRGYLVQAGAVADIEAAPDLCGLTVAVAKGTTMADSIIEQSDECVAAGSDAIDSQIFPDQSACVLAVQAGRSDLTILSAHAALWIAKNSEGLLEAVLRPDEGNDINGIVLRQGDLAVPMQGAVQQLMDSGTLRAIFAEWGLEAVVLDEATINGGT